jgi:hypothetical protein
MADNNCPKIVQKLKGICSKWIAERKAIPETMPGKAMGSNTKNEIVSRPKNRLR